MKLILFVFLLAGAVVGGLSAEESGGIDVPASVSATLRAVAEAAAPALVQLHVDRYEKTLLCMKFEDAGRKEGKRRLRASDRRARDTDWTLFFQYFQRPTGPATGVIVEKTGLVLTSKYNIEGRVRSIQVELVDGRLFPGRILGWDSNLDLAAVQIQADGARFPALPLKPVACPVVGSFVVVIGASWGRVPYTANTGVVSARERLGGSALQLGVHLNYGNTGGAVLDLEGRLIGIAGHVRPFNRTGLNSGVGFASMTGKVLEVLPDLKRGKRVKRTSPPFIGIEPKADKAGKKVYVKQVVPGSGADEAGVRVGDSLVSLAGILIEDLNDLQLALARTHVGQVVTLVVNRGGVVLRFGVRLGTQQ